MPIDIDKLDNADVGRGVVYKTHGQKEYGHITSFNSHNVFVRYSEKVYDDGRTVRRYGETSEATSPDDLEFV